MRTLKCADVSLKFPNLGDLKQCKIMSFNDASYCNLPEEGFIIFLCNKDRKAALIQLQSRKIQHVVKSRMSCTGWSSWSMLSDKVTAHRITASIKRSDHYECITDNQSLQDICYSTKNIEDRRLRVDIIIREMLAKMKLAKLNGLKLFVTAVRLPHKIWGFNCTTAWRSQE